MNRQVARLADDERFASSFEHDLCPARSPFFRAFHVSEFAAMVNDAVPPFDRTTFASARSESSYDLLPFLAKERGELIHQERSLLRGERGAPEGGKQPPCALGSLAGIIAGHTASR